MLVTPGKIATYSRALFRQCHKPHTVEQFLTAYLKHQGTVDINPPGCNLQAFIFRHMNLSQGPVELGWGCSVGEVTTHQKQPFHPTEHLSLGLRNGPLRPLPFHPRGAHEHWLFILITRKKLRACPQSCTSLLVGVTCKPCTLSNKLMKGRLLISL